MRRASLGLLLLAGCMAASSRSSGDRLVSRLMGSNDRLKLEIQLRTAEPVDAAGIRERLLRMARNVEQVPAMEERAGRAAAMLRGLASEPWTPANARERWDRMEQSCAVCHASLSPPPAPPTPLRHITEKKSWEACGRCHRAVYDEWKETLHAGAWIDPVYRMSAGTPPKVECRACHSMEPILAGEIDVDYSWRPVFRDYNPEDGVGCASCHLRADGSVAAREDGDAPCRPRKDLRITTPEFCGACHNPSHDAYNEWKQSASAAQGVSCSGCHSEPVPREGGKTGFSHRFPGGNDAEFLKRSIRTETRLDGSEVVAGIVNLCGHKFPGEVPSRSFAIRVEGWDAAGETLEPAALWLKRPYKSQTGLPDNRLGPDERREFRLPIPQGAARIRVSYLFKPSPMAMERDWTLLDSWEAKVEK